MSQKKDNDKRINKWRVVAALIGFDQITKLIILFFFRESAVINQGFFFGFFAASFLFTFLIICLSILLLRQNEITSYFILSGGVSNIIDRLLRGGVIDYIHIFRFPVFNLADIYISLGTGLLIYKYLIRSKLTD